VVNLIKPTSQGDDDSSTEFYTVEETGDSGMSQTGLAALCGVSRRTIDKLEETLGTKAPHKSLERFVGKKLTLATSEETPDIKVNGKPAGNLRVYTAAFCAAAIRHYDRLGNEVAQYSADQFTEMGINVWIQSITGWRDKGPTRTYIPYWYQRLSLFTSKTRIPDGWWSAFEELAKMMRELEGYGYILPDICAKTGEKITPDISVGLLFCKHMRANGFDVDGIAKKYLHYYPDGRVVDANIYPDDWLKEFRDWFNSKWKRERLVKYLGERDPEALPSIAKLLGLPEADF
jgi:DNA-binding XRE family transcriptional regulator